MTTITIAIARTRFSWRAGRCNQTVYPFKLAINLTLKMAAAAGEGHVLYVLLMERNIQVYLTALGSECIRHPLLVAPSQPLEVGLCPMLVMGGDTKTNAEGLLNMQVPSAQPH